MVVSYLEAYPLAYVYLFGLVLLILVFIVEWFRKRKLISQFNPYGWKFAWIRVGFSLLALFVTGAVSLLFRGNGTVILTLGFSLLVGMLETVMVTALGMYYSAKLGITSLPLIFRRWLPLSRASVPQPAVPDATTLEQHFEADVLPEQDVPAEIQPVTMVEPLSLWSDVPLDQQGTPLVPRAAAARVMLPEEQPVELVFVPAPRVWPALKAGLWIAGISLGYTALLFSITHPSPSLLVRNMTGDINLDSAAYLNFYTILLAVAAAFGEELVFRLGIQNMLAYFFRWTGKKYWIAIGLSALLWTLGHAGSLSPEWVKYVQIFPLGLAFGWAYRKYGLESSFLAHMVFNLLAIAFSSWLL